MAAVYSKQVALRLQLASHATNQLRCPSCMQVLPQQYGGTAELLPVTEAVRKFKLPPYPHLPELRAAKAAAAAAGLNTDAVSVASEAPSADDSSGPNAAYDSDDEEDFHDALEDFAAEQQDTGSSTAAAALTSSSLGCSKLQPQGVAVQAHFGQL